MIFTCFVLIGFIVVKLMKKSGTTAGEKQAGLWLLGLSCSGKDLGEVSHGSHPSACPLIHLYLEMLHFLSLGPPHFPVGLGITLLLG